MQNEERVRERAYAIWEESGRPEGQHDAHWEQARGELGAGEGDPSPAQSSGGALDKSPATSDT